MKKRSIEVEVEVDESNKKRRKDCSTSSVSPPGGVELIEAEYLKVLRPQRFDSVPLVEACQAGKASHFLLYPFPNSYNSYPHSSSSSSSSAGQDGVYPVPQRNTMLRIAKEMSQMNSSLPVEVGSAIFVRCDEGRCDVLKALIVGPEGTPYAHGCFEFDILLPGDYPARPPKVLLATTGGGTVRFNPNLYNCGKVCLSLLGTWSGPGWDPQSSSLLQVLVSIQSLIMVPDPYFNEPGYEAQMGTPAGQTASSKYNESIRQHCFTFAILQQMKQPSYIFREVIRDIFRIKGPLIAQELGSYISAARIKDFHAALAALSMK